MTDEPNGAERLLSAQGVFCGHHGLRGLADAKEFWEAQSYGTRLYYGPGVADYLHVSVLRSAVDALDKAAAELDALRARVAELEAGWAALAGEHHQLANKADALRARVAELEDAQPPVEKLYAKEAAMLEESVHALRAENARLRAALEAAPGDDADSFAVYTRYMEWHRTTRREALDG